MKYLQMKYHSTITSKPKITENEIKLINKYLDRDKIGDVSWKIPQDQLCMLLRLQITSVLHITISAGFESSFDESADKPSEIRAYILMSSP